MAFHVACPITCRRICFCTPGTPAPLVTRQGRDAFLQDVAELEKLLAKPAFLAAGGEETVEVLVPRLSRDLKNKKGKYGIGQGGVESGEDTPISKKAIMRKKATMAAIAVAEAAALAEQAKKAADAARIGASNQLAAAGQVTCEICLFSEVVGSKKAERLVPCPSCKRLFHRNCLKRWADNRDLFNWSSWVCGACRTCEVCRRTGEPNKLMFCKRCDGAIHAYCQQPPLKQVPKGPFLCPKHTLCHSCGSRVPGSGFSSRWFLEYTMCDACGRLFIKGKYCSICLKVYRDSESSPMVCCDNCEHWVHARCDNISDEKYYEFQLDNNLRYTCAACRGDCYKVKGTSDAVEELWRRRDTADRRLIVENQALAGLPPKEENMKLCPSDDEDGAREVDVSIPKKTIKQVTKGRDQDEKALIDSETHKRGWDEIDTSGGSGMIKRLKITLPSSNFNKPKELQHYTNEGEFSLRESSKQSYFSEKTQKSRDDSSIKLTKYMMHARESMATENGKTVVMDQKSGTKAHAIRGAQFDGEEQLLDRLQTRFDKPTSYNRNPVKTVKFVDSSKTTKDARGLMVQSTKKGLSKSETRISPVSATTDEYAMHSQSLSDHSPSDEDGSEQDSGFSQELRDQQLADFGSSRNKLEGREWNYEEDTFNHRFSNFKYRDKNQELKQGVEDSSGAEDLDSNDTSSGFEDARRTIYRKVNRDAMRTIIQDDDSRGFPGRKLNVHSRSMMPLLRHNNGSALRGQRSKRKKHHTLEAQRPTLSTLDVENTYLEEDGEIIDDSRILQKLGRDAVGKKIEIFSIRDGSWHRGRVTEARSLQSQFTVRFDDGRSEAIEFGKRRIRILSQFGKHGQL
ncbi:hypothetical protein KP509_27G068500 [Ceratopteris richardii]|uniref:PHD-type domain-containing protein n=1 Tax=Ceratopteris richardii TaxID=49495 RepID=A0A8T2RIR6_CERRI|nr:hypothetical protein KP509_27G068500 [Ceratopteris richardii]